MLLHTALSGDTSNSRRTNLRAVRFTRAHGLRDADGGHDATDEAARPSFFGGAQRQHAPRTPEGEAVAPRRAGAGGGALANTGAGAPQIRRHRASAAKDVEMADAPPPLLPPPPPAPPSSPTAAAAAGCCGPGGRRGEAEEAVDGGEARRGCAQAGRREAAVGGRKPGGGSRWASRATQGPALAISKLGRRLEELADAPPSSKVPAHMTGFVNAESVENILRTFGQICAAGGVEAGAGRATLSALTKDVVPRLPHRLKGLGR